MRHLALALGLLALAGCRSASIPYSPATADGGASSPDQGSDVDLGRSVDLSPVPDLTGAQSCGGLGGLPCPPHWFCEYTANAACGAADASGSCVPEPKDCVAAPPGIECGCDNQTYASSCLRQSAGVAFRHAGPCQGNSFSCGSQTCGADQYCHQGCCGAFMCTPPPASCENLPAACQGATDLCGCLVPANSGFQSCAPLMGGGAMVSDHGCP